MHQDRCVDLAREAAVACGERHDYMPATDLLAETWQPHRWVIDAMLLAADEAERERDGYMAGNTELLWALMRYAEGQEGAAEFAQDVLRRAGMLSMHVGQAIWIKLTAPQKGSDAGEQPPTQPDATDLFVGSAGQAPATVQ